MLLEQQVPLVVQLFLGQLELLMLLVPVQAVKVVQLVLGVLMFLLGAALVVAEAACPHVDTPVAAAAHHYRSSYRQSAFHGSRNI